MIKLRKFAQISFILYIFASTNTKEDMTKPTIKSFMNIRNGLPHRNLFLDPLPMEGYVSFRTSTELRNHFINDIPEWVCHNFYTLCFSLSETLEYETLGQHQVYPPGTVVITPPYKIHRFNKKCYAEDTFIIIFSDSTLNFFNKEICTHFKYDLLLKFSAITISNEDIKYDLMNAYKELRERKNHKISEETHALYQKAILLKILTFLIEQSIDSNTHNNVLTRSQEEPNYHNYIEFLKLLDENVHTEKGHDVTFYSKKLHIQEKKLTYIISKNVGRTPKQLIIERLENLSKELLLLNRNLRISEISDKLGFNNAAYFSTWFKRVTEFSPQNFRKEYSKKNDTSPTAM